MKNFFLLIAFSTSAFGFTLNNNIEAKFSGQTIAINVASAKCFYNGLTPQKILKLVQRSADQYWNTVPSSSLRLVSGRIIDVDQQLFRRTPICHPQSYDGSSGVPSTKNCFFNPVFAQEEDILVVCNQNFQDFSPNSSLLAITLPHIENRRIKNSVILLNDWPQDISLNPIRKQSESDLVAVLAHEIGHALGLGHSREQNSLMYFTTIPQRSSLGWDDIDAITYLYPEQNNVWGVGLCGSISLSNSRPNPPSPSSPPNLPYKEPFFIVMITMLITLLIFGLSKSIFQFSKNLWRSSFSPPLFKQ